MRKLNNEIKNLNFINELKTSLKQEYVKALKDDNFKAIVEKLPLPEEQIMKYTSKIKECANQYMNCQNCNNLVECKNEVPGFLYTPEILNKNLNFGYVACRYKKALIKKNKYQDNIYYFDIPKEIKEARMANIYTSDRPRLEVIAFLKDFINNYMINKETKGLYLYGNFGSGKTYLVSAMFNELAKKGHKVAIIYWPEFLRDLKASFDNDFAPKFNYIKKVSLLLIDDIGAENMTPWARDEILGPILQYRMQEKLATFFTSNLSIEDLEKHFSNNGEQIKARRIIERIKQLCIEIKLVGKNNRK